MSGEDILLSSADASLSMVRTELFAKLTSKALQFIGSEFLPLLEAQDKPGLFSPVDIEVEGKERQGAILVLEDRAILAWIVGTLRIKGFHAVVPRDTISDLSSETASGGRMTKEREILHIKGDQSWEVKFAPGLFDGGSSLVSLLIGMLNGSVVPVFESDQGAE